VLYLLVAGANQVSRPGWATSLPSRSCGSDSRRPLRRMVHPAPVASPLCLDGYLPAADPWSRHLRHRYARGQAGARFRPRSGHRKWRRRAV